MNSLLEDLRYGVRMLKKAPGFTTIVVITLAIGIGANTAIFSVVDAVLLKPLAIKDPSRIVYVEEQWRDIFPGLSVGNFKEVRAESTSLSDVSASANASFNLATNDLPRRVEGEIVTRDYFATFGVRPLLGRVFTTEEDTRGHDGVVVISERLWRAHLRADRLIIGQSLRINGSRSTVVGVMPESFDPLLNQSDVWIPAAFTPEQLANYDLHYLSVIARRKPGVSLAQAQSELTVIGTRLEQSHPLDDKERSLRAVSLTTALLGDQRPALRMMLAAVGLVLLIACANIANLELARSRSRQKEIAVRAALGASPWRIVRQLLAESIVVGLAGGMAGILLASWALAWIVTKGPAQVPRLDQSAVNGAAIAFACAVALLSSILFGIVPALRSSSMRLNEVFKQTIGTASGSRDRVRSLLVVGEIALALMLTVGAGLLIRSALLVSRVTPGFDATNLVVGRIGLPDAGYREPNAARQTFERMVLAADALPGVESAAVVSRAPLSDGSSSSGLIPEGRAIDASSLVNAFLEIVSPSYLTTVHLPLEAGRDFAPEDTREKTLVTIVNESLARTLWPGQNPIGKRFACCEQGKKGRLDPVWHEVIGVVGDVHARGLDQQVQPEFYLPLAQMPPAAWDWIGRTMDLVARTRGGRIPANDLRTMVAQVAPGVPIYRLSTMQANIAGTLAESHFDTFLLAMFAGIALLLSSVGIYGVLSYVVAQRTRDIGIRIALGATRAHIMRDVLWSGLRLTLIGLALGIAAALAGTRVLSSLLYGVHATDAIAFAGASVVLAAVALLAGFLPARRATHVDPIVALHYE